MRETHIPLWESEEAIRRFAAYLVEKDLHVDHFEVVFADGFEAFLPGHGDSPAR